MQRVDQPRSAARHLDGDAAPKLEPAIDLERLPTIDGHESNALRFHPLHGTEALGHQSFDKIWIAAILCDSAHIIEILIGRVLAEIGDLSFLLGKINELFNILDTVVYDSHATGGELAVAATLVLWRAFEYQDIGSVFARRQCRTQCGVTRSDDNHVIGFFHHYSFFQLLRGIRREAFSFFVKTIRGVRCFARRAGRDPHTRFRQIHNDRRYRNDIGTWIRIARSRGIVGMPTNRMRMSEVIPKRRLESSNCQRPRLFFKASTQSAMAIQRIRKQRDSGITHMPQTRHEMVGMREDSISGIHRKDIVRCHFQIDCFAISVGQNMVGCK